jgi:aspartate aminotransferase
MLAERTRQITGSQTSGMRNKAKQLREAGIDVINLAAGELDFDTSPTIKLATKQAIDDGRTQYTDTMGIRQLREKLAERVSARTGVPYSADEVGVTAGAKQGLFNAALVLFQPGDEVIIPAPYWVTFPVQVTLAGAKPVFLQTEAHDFQINPRELEALITTRTRGIILNTPHNPTGAVYDRSVLEQLAAIAQKHDLWVVFDECYEELVYDPWVHRNIVRLAPDIKERTILINSFSKSYCITGWRAGFVAAAAPVMKAMANLQSHTTSNACSLVQQSMLSALNPDNQAFADHTRSVLRERRERAVELARGIPRVTCVAPRGAFYLFLDVSKLLGSRFHGELISTVDKLAELLLGEAHVAVVAGDAFGSNKHVRVSYAASADQVEEGIKRITRFASQLA